MKLKYWIIQEDTLATIWEHSKHGLVVFFHSSNLKMDVQMRILNVQDHTSVEGEEYEEIKKIILDCIPAITGVD